MNKTQRAGAVVSLLGAAAVIVALGLLQFAPAAAHETGGAQVPLPADYRYWFHIGSKVIRPEGAAAVGLPEAIFGNTVDGVYANTVALNDLRRGTRPFRDGAVFVAPFWKLVTTAGDLDTGGDLAFTAVMVKDSQAFADTGGWGFEAFAPDGTRLTDLRQACVDCHTAQAGNNDLIFSTLSERTPEAVPASDNGVFLPPDYRMMYHVGSKAIGPDAAAAIGLPVDIFGDTWSDVHASATAVMAMENDIRPWPAGTLFVADFHRLVKPVDGLSAYGDLAFTAVMLKKAAGQGDDPLTGDWSFEAFAPDGTPLKDLRGACISCHASQAANDFVFSDAPAAAAESAVPTVDASATCSLTSTASANLRTGPGTNYSTAGSLRRGATADASGQAKGSDGLVWWRLTDSTWVRSDLVNEGDGCDSLPTVEAPAPPASGGGSGGSPSEPPAPAGTPEASA